MECTVVEGKTSDTVEFTRSGVSGRLIVAAGHFDLEAKLGFLLGAFAKTVESEILKTLDELLAKNAPADRKTAAKKKWTPEGAPSWRACKAQRPRSRAAGTPCDASACRAARTMAAAMASAASAPMVAMLNSPSRRPVASEKIASPSAGMWTGLIARA